MPTFETEALEEALERLQQARQDVLDSFDDLRIDLTPIEGALHAWREAVEAMMHIAQAIHAKANDSYEERPEKWQASEKGQAFLRWIDALERLASFDSEPLRTVEITIDLAGPEVERGDPNDAVPDVPELPELEE